MIHPDTALCSIDTEMGLGVRAVRALPKGTIVWVSDALDRVLAPRQWQALSATYQDVFDEHTYLNDGGGRVLLWDETIFMNHSCSPNCHGTLYGFEIALEDIAAGESLTNDYASFGGIDVPFTCLCGAPTCRKRCVPPPQQHALSLAAAFQAALLAMRTLDQPLGALLPPGCTDRALTDVTAMIDAVRTCNAS